MLDIPVYIHGAKNSTGFNGAYLMIWVMLDCSLGVRLMSLLSSGQMISHGSASEEMALTTISVSIPYHDRFLILKFAITARWWLATAGQPVDQPLHLHALLRVVTGHNLSFKRWYWSLYFFLAHKRAVVEMHIFQ